jgi:hypothetical protein
MQWLLNIQELNFFSKFMFHNKKHASGSIHASHTLLALFQNYGRMGKRSILLNDEPTLFARYEYNENFFDNPFL